MTEYLQRLIKRLDRPVQIDSWPTRLTPFIPAPKAGGAPNEAFEEVNEMSLAQESLSDQASRIDEGMEPPPRSPADESVSQPIGSTLAAPLPFTRMPTEISPIANPTLPDIPATETNVRTFEDIPPIAPENLERTPIPSRTIFIEKKVQTPSKPAAEAFSKISTSTPPDLSDQVQNTSQQKIQAEKQPDLETPIAPIAPISVDPLTDSLTLEQRQLKSEHTPSGPRRSEAQTGPDPPPPTEAMAMPTLNPAPAPPLPRIPQPDNPRLVIGRLHVEIVAEPKKASPPAASVARPFRRGPSAAPVPRSPRSKLRFGIGQL